MVNGSARTGEGVALFCATFLRPEMLHVHRHVTGLKAFRPVVIAQKREGGWPVEDLVVIKRSSGRFLARAGERLTGVPWQISAAEADRIIAVMAEKNCRLLHVFFGNVAVHLLPLLRRCPVPVIVSFHGSDVAGSMASPGYARAVREMFRLAALVPCRSRQLIEAVVQMGCPREKTRLMRTALPNIALTPHHPPTDGAWRVVQAARLVPKKGIATALRAFARFLEKHPSATFEIAGEGPMEDELRQLARELKIDDRVKFLGFLSQAALRNLFSAAHIFLHPSEMAAGDVEGVPNALLEAMAGGLPVVATRHGGIAEVVADGETGLLCAENSMDEVTAALLRLASDRALYQRLAEKAAAYVRAEFSAERRMAAVEEIYREAILAHSGKKPATEKI